MSLENTFPDTSGNYYAHHKKESPNKVMLDFFLSTLRVRINRIRNNPECGSSEETKAYLQDIVTIQQELQNKIECRSEEILKSRSGILSFFRPVEPDEVWDDMWNDAYQLQRLMALAEPKDSLILELERVTNQSVRERTPGADGLKRTFDQVSKDLLESAAPSKIKDGAEIPIRMHLLAALEELHWSMQRKFLARPFQKQAARRTVFVGICAFIMFIFPYVWLYCGMHFTQSTRDELHWVWLPAYSALFAGLFGAFFSRLLFLQTSARCVSLGAIADARRSTTILLRGLVGMCGALIVYFFLQSGILEGSVFPNFKDLGFLLVDWPGPDQKDIRGINWCIVMPNKNLALLMVWSFLAGFSERLVPNILASTEKKLGEAAQK
ncbi:MAG: hypothetical protein L0Y57_08425 [Beijerinckiaceae bacterium]|nr:hypothetical protein [Beijerinckiaceae bacterium]